VPKLQHPIFRAAWWSINLLLAFTLLALVYEGAREFSVRRYLEGYSDAIVPNFASAKEKVEAILNWMKAEPSRGIAENPETLAKRDPETTLNYMQLLKVCGTATNAFLNLARASDLHVRRLLLLSQDGTTKHVVAEVMIDSRWIIVDPTYRAIMKDAQGRPLTRKELQNPAIFKIAASAIPNYPLQYDYERLVHVRLERLPLVGRPLRKIFDAIYPDWEETVDWTLLLERESFFYLVLAAAATTFLLAIRQTLALYADRQFRISRFRFREHITRAIAAFFSLPEIKE
jgi:transglutaminase superfamily protein